MNAADPFRQGPYVESPSDLERRPYIEIVTATHARLDGSVVQIDASTWALHGFIAYDGDVLLAEFGTATAALHALHHIPTNTDSDRNEHTP
jgi:hypothetical protein